MTPVYRDNNLCKVHFLEQLRRDLLASITRMYRDPESAFAAFNVRKQEFIRLADILDHDIVRRSGYDKKDVKSYLLREKVFAKASSEIDYIQFKKFFFPKLMQIEARAEN